MTFSFRSRAALLVLPVPLLMALAALPVLASADSAGSVGSADRVRWQAPPTTIVSVTGTRASGFTIERLDGTSLSPPTDSEAAAECGEYDTPLARVRCRVEVRTSYDALGETKRALHLARQRLRQAEHGYADQNPS